MSHTLVRQRENVMQFFLRHVLSSGRSLHVSVFDPSRSQMPFDCSLARLFVLKLLLFSLHFYSVISKYMYAENIHEYA